MNKEQSSWAADWYEPDMVTTFATFVGTSSEDPKKAAWRHFRFLRNGIDSGKVVCSDGAYLRLGKKFHPEGARRIDGTSGSTNQEAMDKRAVVRVSTGAIGHNSSFQAIRRLEKSGEKVVILETLKDYKPSAAPLPQSQFWNGTPINDISNNDMPISHPHYGLHKDSWEKLKVGANNPKFRIVQMANAVTEHIVNKTTVSSAAKKNGFYQSTLTNYIKFMKNQNPIPSTFEEICASLATRFPTANRDGCPDAVKAMPTTRAQYNANNKNATITAQQAEIESLKRKLLEMENAQQPQKKKNQVK